MSKTRRNHGSAFKAKVALEALKGEQTVAEIAAKLHPTLVNEWKRQLADGASSRKGRARPKRTARRWSASFTNKSASRKWNWIFWHASSVAEPGGEASDDRQTEQAPVVNPAMPVAGAQSLVAVLSAGNRQDGRPGADGADRPPVPGDAVLRLAQDDGLAAPRGPCRQSQAGPPADASDGLAGDLAETQHQPAEPRAQGLSVLAARPHHRSAQPSLGDRYYVHPDAQGVLLPGRHHGLAQQEGAGLAAVQYHGRDLLRRGAQGSPGHSRSAGDLQQRPGCPVYQSPACWRPPASGSAWTAKAAAWTMFSWNACGAA